MNRDYIKLPWRIVLAMLFSPLCASPTLAQTCNSAMIKAAPDGRYQNPVDGTVTDLKTGLMWQQCSLGQSGAGCAAGSASTFTWDQALQQAETLNSSGGFAGHTNWRLPNRSELESLIEDACVNPAINLAYFPNIPVNNPVAVMYSLYWTSSPYISNREGVWVVNFADYSALALFGRRNSAFFVRLVRNQLNKTPIK